MTFNFDLIFSTTKKVLLWISFGMNENFSYKNIYFYAMKKKRKNLLYFQINDQ